MNFKMTPRCSLLVFLIIQLNGQGTVINDSFYSVSLGEIRMVDVYLPAGYDVNDTTNRYPVIYFLHGSGGDQNAYGFLIDMLNTKIFYNTIDRVIVVKPDGQIRQNTVSLPESGDGSWYINSELTGYFEDYIVNDLVNYIDSTYNTIASKDYRAIMGHSMGGYGAMKLGLEYVDVFSGIASSQGADLSFNFGMDDIIHDVLIENGGSGPFDPDSGFATYSLFYAACFHSPNLNNPPYFVDLPIDNSGNYIDSIWSMWISNDPVFLATQVSLDSSLAIYFDCGTQDFLFPVNEAFVDSLDSLGLPYEYYTYQGSHGGNLTLSFSKALAFIDSVMWQGVPRAYDTEVNPVYLSGTGEVTINTQVTNPCNHSVVLSAMLRPHNESVMDTVNLFDDGTHSDGFADDGVWGGLWSVPSEETTYSIDIKSVDVDSAVSNTQYDIVRFTTIGPLVFDGIAFMTDTIVEPGDLTTFWFALKNLGSTGTATSVTAYISSEDSCLEDIDTDGIFEDIGPGESIVLGLGGHTIRIKETCPGNIEIPFTVTIKSDNYHFWTDSFTIYIHSLGVDDEIVGIPQSYSLHQNHPNPFNPVTTIRYEIPQRSDVQITIFDLLGREVITLVSEIQESGYKSVQWDASNMASGMYFYQIRVYDPDAVGAGDFIQTRKMVVLK